MLGDFQTALDHFGGGRFDEAELVCLDVLFETPEHAEALHLLGVVASLTGRPKLAAALLGRGSALDRDRVEACADEICQFGETEVVQLDACEPRADIAANFQAAVAHHQAGDLMQAELLYRQVLQADSTHSEAWHLFGVLAGQVGQSELATDLIGEAISSDPSVPRYYNNLGVVLNTRGMLDEALKNFRMAIVLQPDYSDAYKNMGAAFHTKGALDDAERCYRTALQHRPDCSGAYSNLGVVAHERGFLAAAYGHFQRALELAPDDVEVMGNMAGVLKDKGNIAEAIACYKKALSLAPDFIEMHSNLLMALHYDERLTPLEVAEQHRAFGDRFSSPISAFSKPVLRSSVRKLRIGFVSGDLCSHPVGFFLEGVLSRLDRQAFELFLYPTHARSDALTARLRDMGHHMTSLVGLGDEAACDRIRSDGIDILVDLSGHTAHNRLGVLARKPAPIQLTWLGYFATTGLSAIDYIIADPVSVQPGESSLFSEKIWQLPDTRFCFTPPEEKCEVGPLPAIANGFVTFGCFNNLSKVNDKVLSLWSKLLRAAPSARLFLKAKQLNDLEMRERILARFGEQDVSPEQLIVEGWSSRSDYLAAYRRVDIALDPFPFTGGATTVEGFWMGVPLITRQGDRMLARQGESFLHSVGLSDWIAPDDDSYVQAAIKRARDLAALADLRQRLRPVLLASPLCDRHRFATQLGAAFEQMWQTHCGSSIRKD